MVYRTMQGREIDMEKLMRQNELTPAVGNLKVNARGDQLGQGGEIVKKREEVVAEYYEAKTPKRKKVVETPVEPVQSSVKKTKPSNSEEQE